VRAICGDREVHRSVVLAGLGNDQVHRLNQAIGIDAVVVKQGAARRLAYPHRPPKVVHPCMGAHMSGADLGIVEQGLDRFERRQEFRSGRAR